MELFQKTAKLVQDFQGGSISAMELFQDILGESPEKAKKMLAWIDANHPETFLEILDKISGPIEKLSGLSEEIFLIKVKVDEKKKRKRGRKNEKPELCPAGV